MSKTKPKNKLQPDFLRQDRDLLVRRYCKSVRFNKKELSFIDSYCEKFNIHSRSAFFRDCIIGTALKEMDENYPKLF